MKKYDVTEELNQYIIGSTVIDSFVDPDICEGGLVVIFEKSKQRGIAILGYTELGEWIEYLQAGSKVVQKAEWVASKEINHINKIAQEYNIS
ncbi:MAG TPA: hypothetical protein DEP23_01630 [Ruminococcaceae bacterium]|jgi:hypothetical protein|nr:hypothetical protein [Oscillospiraceae bacterium]